MYLAEIKSVLLEFIYPVNGVAPHLPEHIRDMHCSIFTF